MVRKIKMVGRLPRTLGLTVTAMLAFGVIAANAQALGWYVEGAPLGGEKAFTLKGPEATFTIHTAGSGLYFKCSDVQGTGVIKGPAGGSGQLTASECELQGWPGWCDVQPIKLNVTIGLTEKNGKLVETFTPGPSFKFIVKDPYEMCPWWQEEIEFKAVGGQLGAEFPKGEAKAQAVTGSKEFKMGWYWGKEPNEAYLEGPMTQQLTSGEVFGIK